MDLDALPKVELHLHADCSLSAHAIERLTPGMDPDERARRYVPAGRLRDLPTFLEYATRLVGLLQTENALRLMVDDVMDQLAAENVVYAELRFAPHQHLSGGLAVEDVVRVVDDQLGAAIERTGVTARLLLCTLMHYPAETSLEVARLAAGFLGTHVTGFDIAGDSVNYTFAPHQDACRLARRSGVRLTIHAGEAAGPESVSVALDELGATRIGHGFRVVEDTHVRDQVLASRTHLEVCPRNNVLTGNAPDVVTHPVTELFAAGASLGISSDSRTLTGSLGDEYAALVADAGWSPDDLRRANALALDAAFVEDEVKRELMPRLLG